VDSNVIDILLTILGIANLSISLWDADMSNSYSIEKTNIHNDRSMEC